MILFHLFQVCYQINVDVIGAYMNAHGVLLKKGPDECQDLCQQTVGCVWFSWTKILLKNSGSCKLINQVTNFVSSNSTTGIISGPAKCRGMIC